MPRLRVGVALLLPAPVATEVDGLRRAAGDGSLGRVPPHITLVPPVNVPESRMGEALSRLREAAAATAPLRVALGPPTTFLPHTPVLYLPVSGEGTGAEDVRSLRDRVFEEPLARPLTWPFVPHVTLAEDLPHDRLAAAVAALADYRVEVTFDAVHLLQERPGRVWEPIAEATFTPAVVVGRGGLPTELTVTGRPDPEVEAFAAREDPDDVRVPFVVTARRDGEVVGMARGWTAGGVAHVTGLLVASVHQGSGVGSRLLAAVESLAAERDCLRLSATVVADGPLARFYGHRGWRPEGGPASWLDGRDFVTMRRDL